MALERFIEVRGADAFVLKGSLDWADLLTEIERFVGPPPGVPDDQREEPAA